MSVKRGLLHWGKNIGWGCARTGCWVRYLDLRWMRYQGSGEGWVKRRYTILFLNKYYLGYQIQINKNDIRTGLVARMGRREVCKGFLWENLKESGHFENLGIDGTIILKWIIKKWEGSIDWIDLAQNRNRRRPLSVQQEISRFHKMRKISWLTEELSASQEEISDFRRQANKNCAFSGLLRTV